MTKWIAVLALWWSGSLAALTPGPHNLEHQHDTVTPDKAGTSFRIEFPGQPCTVCWGDTVRYTTFSTPEQVFEAKRHDGRFVTLLIPAVHPREAEVTEDRLRVLVDRLDLLYLAYRELLGWEPAKGSDPLGKQVFAVLPNEPANFYGLAFVPGDASEYSNAVLGERALDDDILSNVWVHELAHNFDPVFQWDYGPDPAHDWTTILQNWFARRQAHMDEANRTTWDAVEAGWLNSFWKGWRNGSSLTWQQCAATSPRPAECATDNALFLTGNLMVEVGKFIPGTQMADWMRRGLAAQNGGANITGAEARSDFMLAMLADATRSDTRCIATRFRWHQGPGLAIVGQYPTPFPGCLDADNDGAQRFDDCDDGNPNVKPGAAEIADGRDNDCDGQIDESAVSESTAPGGDFGDNSGVATPIAAAPITISGSFAERAAGTAADVDHVRLAATIGPVNVRLCATGVAARVGGIATNGVGWAPLASAAPGGCGSQGHTFETWQGFFVYRDAANTATPGSYTLEITLLTPAAWPRPTALKLVRSSNGAIRADINAANVQGGLDGAELRWYQTGQGERARGAASEAASQQAPALTSTAFSGRRPVQLRAQLYRGGLPIEEPSNPIWIPASTHLATVPADGRFSGSWYSPRHNGEGFLIEMLPDNRFLAYWFTYDPAAWNNTVGNAGQQWLLADGVVDGQVLRASLTRVSGGRYGSAMNPAQLVLSQVGEIEFAFSGDNIGTVHYRVDGRSGEFELERLTGLRTGAGARGLSGSWYQPSLRGQGLVVQETTNNELVAVMFTFDANQKLAWASMLGTIGSDGSISFASAPFRARGGLFGRGYRNASIVADIAGTSTLTLNCSQGRFSIHLPSIAGTTQNFNLERITTPLGTGCPGGSEH